jgi:hypothetical protein
VQTDVLDRCPDNREATTLRSEHINLIGALPYIAEQTFNGIGRLDKAVHALRKRIIPNCLHAVFSLHLTLLQLFSKAGFSEIVDRIEDINERNYLILTFKVVSLLICPSLHCLKRFYFSQMSKTAHQN